MAQDDHPSSLKYVRNPTNFSHALRSSSSLNDATPSSRWRRNRSSVNIAQSSQADPVPLNPSLSKPGIKMERTPSKMSLFSLFSKPKVEKARGHTEVGLAVPMRPQTPPKSTATPSQPASGKLDVEPPRTARSRASVMFRSAPQKTPTPKVKPLHWEPPPLFQAYPQAIKHATVQACASSPDTLLRIQSQRRQYNLLREKLDSQRDLAATLESVPETKKLEKSHKRLTSNSVLSLTTPDLTSKIYVLVTSGYVLQYAGDGPFNRLPEKVLQLGKESAAFASDAIQGKHWVLQISQSAKEDGTVSVVPKSSLLTRLRSQNSTARKTAASFLLVLESAEEMDSWLTVVRKEIDALGGMKAKDEVESKTSTDTSSTASPLRDPASHRYLIQRDPNRISKMAPVDSPFQSQMGSPQIIASSWEEEQEEQRASGSDSSRSDSNTSQNAINRKSMEAPSTLTTAVSVEQFQLDQLRERSRHSYISNATSASGTQTRNTSRNSSPAPNSPLKEGFAPAETEQLRSATSLRSFHMNPNGSATANWRRSMQPLPVTTEDSSLSTDAQPASPQRHSVYLPPSPIFAPEEQPVSRPTATPTLYHRPLSNRFNQSPPKSVPSFRSSSAPPARIGTISPPPRDPAPAPPMGRPQSTIGNLPGAFSTAPMSRSHSKPFLRPIPVRPQNADGAVVVPRRFSSLGPPPIPLGIVVNRSVTAPIQRGTTTPSPSSPQTPPVPTPAPAAAPAASHQLRRPTSMQIRSSHAAFLSSSRPTGTSSAAPARAISSTPSFVPGNRASMLHQSPSNPGLKPQQPMSVMPKRSMPVISSTMPLPETIIALPPPAPPPNMPLPPPPPVVQNAAVVG